MQNLMLIAEISLDPLYKDTGLTLAVMGMLVVFAALVLVSVFIGTLPKMIALSHHFFPETDETAHGTEAVSEATDDIPEHVVVIIAAVVADMVGVRHRILHTRQLTPDDMSWALEGRLQHHASHQLQPRDRTNR